LPFAALGTTSAFGDNNKDDNASVSSSETSNAVESPLSMIGDSSILAKLWAITMNKLCAVVLKTRAFNKLKGRRPRPLDRAINSRFPAAADLAVSTDEEIKRLRGIIAQQERELRGVKRLVVVHSIFYKWKVWYLLRLQERLATDMEEERLEAARRIEAARMKMERIYSKDPSADRESAEDEEEEW
jgi:hypothetical protein